MEIPELVSIVRELMENHRPLFLWMAAGSVLVFLASIILIPWLVVRLPQDFFLSDERAIPYLTTGHPVFRVFLIALKNVTGVTFILAGIIMLFIPGQGILTIIVGVMLSSFPGKQKLVYWFASRDRIFRSLNALRRRWDRPPFVTGGPSGDRNELS